MFEVAVQYWCGPVTVPIDSPFASLPAAAAESRELTPMLPPDGYKPEPATQGFAVGCLDRTVETIIADRIEAAALQEGLTVPLREQGRSRVEPP